MIGRIHIDNVDPHEDGSATYTVRLDEQTWADVAGEGLRLVIACAAYKVNIEDVHAWIEEQGKGDHADRD